MRNCAAALVQMQAVVDADQSLAQALDLTRHVLARRPDLVLLPENYGGMGDPRRRRQMAFDPATPAAHPAVAPFLALSVNSDAVFLLGGTPERGPGASTYNTAVVIHRGHVVATYRKIHLFDLEQGDVPLRESAHTSPGTRPIVLEAPWGKIGVSICYDLRFPHLFTALAAAGAEILVVPSAFTLRTGMDHWEVLLRARAIETQCYVLAAAQWGAHGLTRESYGHSMAVDPWGTVIAQASAGPGVVWAELRADVLTRARALLPTAGRAAPLDETLRVPIPFGGSDSTP